MRNSVRPRPTPSRDATLAWACDHAGCTLAQAGALRLYARGRSIRQVAGELGLTYAQARAALDNGRERLECAFHETLARKLHWFRALLHLIKNRFDVDEHHSVGRNSCSAPILTYAPIGNGQYDARPVTVRARPHGSVAEDFLEDHRDLLRVLLAELA